MKKTIIIFLLILSSVVFSGCASPRSYEGGAAGGVVGGIAGAMLDKKNPWRGGVKGALLGGAYGAMLTEISAQAARDAAIYNRPVKYVSEDRRNTYVVEPIGNYNGVTKCRKVRERAWESGLLVNDHISEVCTGTNTERRY